MKRLFFALWPNVVVRKQCANLIQNLDNGQGKTVQPDNLHLTLLFLGHLPVEKEIALMQETSLVVVPEIKITFNQISYWKKPGILCLTTTETNRELIGLVDQLTSIARKLSIRVDDRPFEPHVTLLRKVNGVAALEFDTIDWQSSSFCLAESFSHVNKVEYQVVENWGIR